MLKPLSALLALLIMGTYTYAQNMHAKAYNYTFFSTDVKNVPDALNQYSSEAAKQHPEYGILPPHTSCQGCVELVEKRGIDSREYFDPQQPGRTFSQHSYFPLHYKKTANDVWHSIDERLRPTGTPGVFIADRQPNHTKSDINRKSTSITVGGIEIEFNKNVSMYYVDGNNAESAALTSNYSQYTAGDEGVYIKDIWQGIDMEQHFSLGEVKSTYVVNQPLDIPIANGYLVIEDHIQLPTGYSIAESASGTQTEYGYEGDYEILNVEGKHLLSYKKASLYDSRAWGIAAGYQLEQHGNQYTIKMLVPIAWLTLPENKFPLYLDPQVVSGNAKRGAYLTSQNEIPDNMGFTTIALGSCDHHLAFDVPGKSQLTNSFIELEYRLTYDANCGNPALPSPFCTVTQVRQTLINDQCNVPVNLFCNQPTDTNYINRCTSDPVAIPGATPIKINTFVPSFLTCIPPTCDTFHLAFTMKNQDSICGDQCGYLCASGTMWAMTVEACRVDGFQTQNKTQVCAGETAIFTAHPNCGVPPYSYVWTTDGTHFDTTTTPNYPLTPQTGGTSLFVSCNIVDACGVIATANDLELIVNPTPTADAGPDQYVCLGGPITLGGNPTTNGNSITWTGSTPTVQSWLTSNSFPNPTSNIPVGTIDTFFYVVRTSNGGTCVRRDTAYVYSTAGPTADAGPDQNLCGGGTATIGNASNINVGFNIEWSSYGNPNASAWLSNPNIAMPIVNIPAGTIDTVYYVIQVYSGQGQCSRRDTMAIYLPQPPLSNAGTDVSLCEGGIATLGGTPAAGPGTTILWGGNNTTAEGYLSSTTAANPIATIPSGTIGNYQYILTVTDPNCSRRDTVLVGSYAYPVAIVDTGGPTTICSNTSVILSTQGTFASYAWSNGATTQTITVNADGNYLVTVTDANGCTAASNAITVTTIAAPSLTIYPDTAINYGDSITLYTDIDLALVDSFAWYPTVNISCTQCPNPIVTPEQDTYYGLIAYANGCPATDTALIKIILKNNFYIPNAFTPNGDFANDDFYVYAEKGVRVVEFQIYNRLGEKIHDGLYPWDGTYKGKPCPPGTYVYIARMALFGQQQGILRKGSVTLIK